MPLGSSPHAKQTLVQHVQEAQIRAPAESSRQSLPREAFQACIISLTSSPSGRLSQHCRKRYHSHQERHNDSRTGQHHCHGARRGCQDQELLCDQPGHSRRPHHVCPEFWDNLGISVCQGRLLGLQQGAGLFLKVTLNQMVVATVTAALLWHKIHHTSLPQHFQLCSVK